MNTTEAILKTRQLLCDYEDRHIAWALDEINSLQEDIKAHQATKEQIQAGVCDTLPSFLQLMVRDIS